MFPSKRSEMEFACRKQGNANDGQTFNEDSFLRLRGLPFTSNEDDLMKFFAGILAIRISINELDYSKA